MTQNNSTVKTIRQSFDKAITANLMAQHTLLICQVTSYDLNGGFPIADLKPINKFMKNDGTYLEPSEMLQIPCPPLEFGGFLIHARYKKGDFVVVEVMERSLEEWLENGKPGVEASNKNYRQLKDAIVSRKIRFSKDKISALSEDALLITNPEQTAYIKLEENGRVLIQSEDINLGGLNGKKVALEPEVKAEISALRAELAAHVHPLSSVPVVSGTTPVGTATGFTTASTTITTTVRDMASSKVKAE